MGTTRLIWRSTVTALLVLTFVLPAIAAHAEDDAFVERVKEYEALVKEHRRAKAGAALQQDARNGVELYKEAATEEDSAKLQARIVKGVGALTKVRDDSVRRAALESLGAMGDEAGVRYVKPHLKVLKDGKGSAVTLTAIEVAGQIGDDAFIAPLLKIVDKAKYLTEAATAMRTLGKFAHCRRQRARILAELATTLRKDLPGGPKRGQESQVADTYIPGKNGNSGTARWQALSPVLPQALNELTGQSLATATDWMDIVQENKRNLGALFANRDS